MSRLVALALPGGPEYVEAIQRVWDAGDAIAPVDLRLPAAERDRMMATLRAGAVIEADGEIRSLPDGEPIEDGDAVVIATSGTAGEPKAVIHTHAAVEASAMATSKALAVDPAVDTWLACLPLAHIGGLSVVLRSLVTGTGLQVHDGFRAEAVAAAAADGATLVSLVMRALNQIDPSQFRAILVGGAAPPPDRAPNVIATYGMTETGSGVVYDDVILEGAEISIGPPGPDGPSPGPPDDDAELYIRGPMLFRGYRGQPDPFLAGGWFPTGDLGRWGPDGQLAIAGRRGDLIVTGGEKVWPEPVERALLTRADVAEVAVVGRRDPEWGHRVVAVVVPANGRSAPTLADLRETVTETLPVWAAPKELEVAADLPRTSLGKVRRNLL